MTDSIRPIYDSLDDIPESIDDFRSLFTERNGKYELTGVAGIKTPGDTERLQRALDKERDEHKATKSRFAPWAELDHDDVMSKLDRIPELEAAAGDKLDENALAEMANKRAEGIVKSRVSPLERKLAKALEERDGYATRIEEFEAANVRRSIGDATRKALVEGKVLAEAHDDALLLAERVFEVSEDGEVVTRDGVGITPGLSPRDWLAEIQDRKPHWWGASVGGGARGSGGSAGGMGRNPWTADGWNLTEQGRILKEKGTEYAERLAKAAGTTVGGTKPRQAAGSRG